MAHFERDTGNSGGFTGQFHTFTGIYGVWCQDSVTRRGQGGHGDTVVNDVNTLRRDASSLQFRGDEPGYGEVAGGPPVLPA